MAHVMKTAGSRNVTLAELEALPVPESMGRFHRPIPFHENIKAWYAALDRAGVAVVGESFAINPKNSKLFGVFDVENGHYGVPGHTLSIGFRTSTDETLGNRAVAGNRVTVCDNLILSGAELVLSRKSTTHANLPWLLDRGIPIVKRQWDALNSEIMRMARTNLAETQAKGLLYDLFQQRALPSRLFHTVDNLYFRPTQEMLDVHPRTVYGVHNALTRAIKELEPQPAFDATIRVHRALASHRVLVSA